MQQADIGQGRNEPDVVRSALSDRVHRVQAQHGPNEARTFAAVAMGTATPLAALLDRWFAEKAFTVGYKDDIRRAMGRLEQWCKDTATPITLEAINTATAGRFIHERYVEPKVDWKTANKDISSLHSYWRYLKRRHGIIANPWHEQRLEKPKKREEAASADKRAFTDEEVGPLLGGIRLRREWEFSLFAAVSGLRVHEIAGLRVKHCADGRVAVVKSKTPSGVRTIPAHPLLATLIERRTMGKRPDDYLFEDLPEQAPGSKRDRSAPLGQSFTRERRRLGVEEKGSDKQRQSNIDFHSWRRWFIRRAVSGLEKGAVGYTPWTIASVVGHKVEGGKIEGIALPLGMTMGHYAGPASWEAMTACVNAVSLPEGTLIDRTDLAGDLVGGRGLRRRKRASISQLAAE